MKNHEYTKDAIIKILMETVTDGEAYDIVNQVQYEVNDYLTGNKRSLSRYNSLAEIIDDYLNLPAQYAKPFVEEYLSEVNLQLRIRTAARTLNPETLYIVLVYDEQILFIPSDDVKKLRHAINNGYVFQCFINNREYF